MQLFVFLQCFLPWKLFGTNVVLKKRNKSHILIFLKEAKCLFKLFFINLMQISHYFTSKIACNVHLCLIKEGLRINSLRHWSQLNILLLNSRAVQIICGRLKLHGWEGLEGFFYVTIQIFSLGFETKVITSPSTGMVQFVSSV